MSTSKTPETDAAVERLTDKIAAGVLEEAVSDAMTSMHSRSKTLTVTRMYKDHGVVTKEEVDEEQIEVVVPPPEVPLAKVSYGVSMTINTGDFESVKLSCGIELPAMLDEAAEAYKTAKAFVDKRLNAEVSDVREYRSRKGKK